MKIVSEVLGVVNDVPREEGVESRRKPQIMPTRKECEEKEQFAKEHKERPDEYTEHQGYVWPKKPFQRVSNKIKWSVAWKLEIRGETSDGTDDVVGELG